MSDFSFFFVSLIFRGYNIDKFQLRCNSCIDHVISNRYAINALPNAKRIAKLTQTIDCEKKTLNSASCIYCAHSLLVCANRQEWTYTTILNPMNKVNIFFSLSLKCNQMKRFSSFRNFWCMAMFDVYVFCAVYCARLFSIRTKTKK